MFRFLLLIIVLIASMSNKALANPKISNLITPVSYFVNHLHELHKLSNNLSKYRKTSLIGTSGIGKTQLARTYSYENSDKYNLIWFFDCNLDVNVGFVRLAKQLNQINNANISVDAHLARQEVIGYLTNQKGWLLVFDNLKIGENHKVQDIVNWENNGNIIFCSQESDILPHISELTKFKPEDAKTLARNILEDKNEDSARFLAEVFKGYPILIVQGSQLLNHVKGLDKEEYKNKIYHSADKIKLNIDLAIERLPYSASKLLKKIALINNQSFSKQMLDIITDSKETLSDDIYQLSKFALILNIKATEDNPVYEMHDIIVQKILEINGEKNNKNYLENTITKLLNAIPNNVVKAQIFRDADTIYENLNIIAKNAEKYDINIYKLLELNLQLMTQYSNTADLYNAKILVNWFDAKEKEGKFKLWLMNNDEKANYARYLARIAWYYRKGSDPKKALDCCIEALKIFDDVKGFESFKCNTYFGLAMINILLGQISDAEKNIKIMEQMFDKNMVEKTDIGTLFNAKARLFFAQGKNKEALEYIDKSIEAFLNNGAKVGDIVFTSFYLLRAEILNALGRYQEAHAQEEQFLNMHKSSNKKNSDIFGRIYTQLARSELGLGHKDKAKSYIKEAIGLFISDKNRSTSSTEVLGDPDLAISYVVQGDVLFAKGRLEEAIKSYRHAQKNYFYLYQDNMKNVPQVSYLYLQGAKASCKAKDLYHYKSFGRPQIKEFGTEHPNTISILEYCNNSNMDLWSEED